MTQRQQHTFDSDAQAAAYLLGEHLNTVGVVDAVALNGDMVAVTTHGRGFHLGNVHASYEADVHLLCDPDAVRRGPLFGEIPDESTVYANISVDGLKPPETDGFGYALPTHKATTAGVERRAGPTVPETVHDAARRLGIYE